MKSLYKARFVSSCTQKQKNNKSLTIDIALYKVFIQNNKTHKCQNLILNVKMVYNTTFD